MIWPTISLTGVSEYLRAVDIVDDKVRSYRGPVHTICRSIPQLTSVSLTRCHIESSAECAGDEDKGGLWSSAPAASDEQKSR